MKHVFVFIQLGSPDSLKTSDVRKYLKKFLGDPRVIDLPKVFWFLILNLFILPFRPRKSKEAYARIWTKEGSPLVLNTEKFILEVKEHLKKKDLSEYTARSAYIIGSPSLEQVMDEFEEEKEKTQFYFVPLFPQYSEATSASAWDQIKNAFAKSVNIPTYKFLSSFHLSKAFIDNSLVNIETHLDQLNQLGKNPDLVISFHGLPKNRITIKGDYYYKHCLETYLLLENALKKKYPNLKMHLTFQSRFGTAEWLSPYTDKYCQKLAKEGTKDISVYCPSFAFDCLETLDEIGNELAQEVNHHGAQMHLVPCLNATKKWTSDFTDYLVTQTISEKEALALEYLAPETTKINKYAKEFTKEAKKMDENRKKVLKIVFLTLFMDLVGFSIIFPLFPALAKHYLLVDSENIFLKFIFQAIASLVSSGGEATMGMKSIVLFGGALGALYSFLQFLAAPLWGSISDRIGRRPVLLISVFFLGFSYLLWFFSGSFTLLIFARIIGGIMGGNISTATAVVADVTTSEGRARGMAVVGIAFALGFIIGPALGGISSLLDLTKYYPSLASYGVNPFSMAALVAFILSCINFIWLYRVFPETLPPEKRGKATQTRTINPLTLLKPLPYKGLNLTNFSNFFFLSAFSGMEFTLTFLAAERLSFTPMQNGIMFIFIGFVLAGIQGGVVRRKAHQYGEKRMSLVGMLITVPGLIIIGYTTSVLQLYLGLFFLACGSAMIIPCLTALASRYTPASDQGKGLGIFRSLGALARVIGPILASLLYWHQGSTSPYVIGAIFMSVPFIFILSLPEIPQEQNSEAMA